MAQDGSQYDATFPWEQEVMLQSLEEELAALEVAETEEERQRLRTSAQRINEDLIKLHGIDLGPF